MLHPKSEAAAYGERGKISDITQILQQCQKPGFWKKLCIKTDIFIRNPVSRLVIENAARCQFNPTYRGRSNPLM
ncbi:hypothetical protein HC766_06845 [Candidatus Gracilibacteria bacterium]|nr:hypothetical protein [Candidatus Gracilibacteria bacterium]